MMAFALGRPGTILRRYCLRIHTTLPIFNSQGTSQYLLFNKTYLVRKYASPAAMKAIVYHGPGKIVLEDRPKPAIQQATDAIVRMKHASICGTDLHILRGDVPTVIPGRILGHEGVGVVESVGSAVAGIAPGDPVIVSCVTACGVCNFCRKGICSHCEYGGWILGNMIDGTQAEYVRVPHAQSSLFKTPANVAPRTAVVLSDAFPTSLECGVLRAKVEPGSTLALIGAGPVGLAAIMNARLYSPSLIAVVDTNEARLETARRLGAHATINSSDMDEARRQLLELTDGQGFDGVIEAVGIPATFALCQEIIAVGGSIANLGVHGKKVDLHLEKLWDQNISINASLVDTTTIPMLLRLFESGQLDASSLITHTFKLGDSTKAYETCKAAAEEKAMKIVIDID